MQPSGIVIAQFLDKEDYVRQTFMFSLLLLVTSLCYGVCLTELDAEIYGCIEIRADRSKSIECKKRHGDDFKAYYTTNTCSEKMAASTRYEPYDENKQINEVVEAACMSFEQGENRGCTIYDYDLAEKYCVERFGHRYVPFIIEGKNCTKEEASKARGEVNSSLLIQGLESDFEEIEKMMTMLDKEGMNNSLGGIISSRPNIDTEFYVGITKRIMARMNMAKDELYKRSHFKLSVVNPHTKKFLKYVFRYKSLLARLYKLYAYVAHQNHYVLNSYRFENLEYLDLKLRKDFALEVLAKVNYGVRTIERGKSLLLTVDEVEKQTYEYQAIQDPEDKTDYAKLVSFMGVRENLVNLWAVQKMSDKKIQNSRVSSCGKGLLSFRPGTRGRMELSNAMVSLKKYDVFYNDYAERMNDLIEQSKKANILDESKALELFVELTYNNPTLKKFLQSKTQLPLETRDDFIRLAEKDSKMLILAEEEAWNDFANYHFSTIVLPGDDVLDKWKIINRIWRDSFEKRVSAIEDAFVGAYVWFDDITLKKIRFELRELIEKRYKDSFFKRTKSNLIKAFANYNDLRKISKKFRNNKVDAVAAMAYSAAHAAYVDFLLSEKKSLKGISPITPISKEELISFFNYKVDEQFYDVRYTMEKDKDKAKIVDDFFKRVDEIFISETESIIKRLENETLLNRAKILMFEENQFLSDKLREAAVIAAREYYLNYPFEVTTLQSIDPSNMYIFSPQTAEEKRKLWQNRHRLQVDTTGTPIAVDHIEMKRAFKAKIKDPREQRRIKRTRERLFGITRIRKGHNRDKVTTGEISQPLSIDDKGIITTPRGINSVANNQLIDMYIRSGNINELAGERLRSRKKEIINYDSNKERKGNLISDNREFFYRMLEALDLAWISYVDDRASTYYGSFIQSDKDQGIIASLRIAKAYQIEPILRNELTWEQRESSLRHNGFNFYTSHHIVTYSRPLLVKIAMSAFSTRTLEMYVKRAKSFINIAIDNAVKNVPEKLSKFCKANFLRYKNDSQFKEVYTSANFIRATLKSGVGISEEQKERIQKFDEGVRKDIRGIWDSWNEDYIEPSLHILGTAALISIGIMFLIGTSGLAAPGIMGTIYSVASTFLAVEFFISFPLIVGSLYTRINTHFIEVPAQLKFQKALATSQLDNAKIVDWDLLKSAEDQNSTSQAWTAGFAPFDFLYGYSLIKHVRNQTGLSAVAAYQRQTGMKLRKWSAPAVSMLHNSSFKELRKRNGIFKAILEKTGDTARRVRMHLPKYQQISEEMIQTTPLRLGLSRAAKKMSIHNRPWMLLKDLNEYTSTLRSRYMAYQQYVQSEAKLIQRYRYKGRFKFRDLRMHGMIYSAVTFIPKSVIRAIKTKRFGSFLKNYGKLWNELKSLQGELVHQRVENLQKIIDKLEHFKSQYFYGNYQRVSGSPNLMDDFQRLLTDEEILMLEEVAKYSKGYFRGFKQVFKDHKIIVEGLRPMSYQFGHAGERFGIESAYPQNIIMGEKPFARYSFENTSEDIVNFYESLLKQNAKNSPDLNSVRREIEEDLSRRFIYKPNGERIFFD